MVTHIIIFLNIMTEIETSPAQSKKASCQLAKFHYHLTNTIPELFQHEQTPSSQTGRILQARRGQRNMNFYFAQHTAEGVSSLDAEAILDSARKLYITSDCVRVGGGCFKKCSDYKVPYLPLYGRFQEIIEFHLLDKNDTAAPLKSSIRRRSSSSKVAKKT